MAPRGHLPLVLAARLSHPVLGRGIGGGGQQAEVAPPVLLHELPGPARAHAAPFPRQPAGLGRPGHRVVGVALRRRLLLPGGTDRVAAAFRVLVIHLAVPVGAGVVIGV
jgi:hypothetical protein